MSDDFAVEFRQSEKKSIQITKRFLDTFLTKCKSIDKLPKLILKVKKNEKEVYVLDCKIWIERKSWIQPTSTKS